MESFAGFVEALVVGLMIYLSPEQAVNSLLPSERVLTDTGYRGCDSFLSHRWDTLRRKPRCGTKLHTHLHFEHIERVNRRC